MSTPLVSVVIVTWNRRDDVLETIRSVEAQNYSHTEVIVVDNGSEDGTIAAISTRFPNARIIALGRNVGAASGRSVGIRAARGEIVFLLDSDASLEPDTLPKVVDKFAREPQLGVVMCKIVNASTRELDPHSGWIYAERNKVDQDTEFASYSFCSAGAAVRRAALDRAGLFWGELFIYREEDDLSLRVWDSGYTISYWPMARVLHRVSPTARTANARRLYYDLRNSLFIYLVRYPWWMLVMFVPLKIAVSLLKGARGGSMDAVRDAIGETVARLPQLLGARRPISTMTARRYLRLQRQHGPLSWDLRSWMQQKV